MWQGLGIGVVASTGEYCQRLEYYFLDFALLSYFVIFLRLYHVVWRIVWQSPRVGFVASGESLVTVDT